MKTPLTELINWTIEHYGMDDLNIDSLNILNKAKDLLNYEQSYMKDLQVQSYDYGYETGLRQAVAKSYDA